MSANQQLPLFFVPPKRQHQAHPEIATTAELEALLNDDPVFVANLSSGKDGWCAALIAMRYLDAIGHAGPRLCVHADLGRVEWKGTQELCEAQARHLGLDLLTVRRPAGGLLERWQQRWRDNLTRYRKLACARVILPWSTAAWRFCTSELKQNQIARALKKRYPGRAIVNMTGIRRQESRARSVKPVLAPDKVLRRMGVDGWVWHPAIEYLEPDVWTTIRATPVPIHPSYAVFGATRHSCVFCVLSSLHNLVAGTRSADNHAVYVELVKLEALSTFSFQPERWLADVAPSLLDAGLQARVADAKRKAIERARLEAQLPSELEFVNGLPTCLPSIEDARLLASVRREIAQLLGIEVHYTTGEAVQARYAQLMAVGRKALKDVSDTTVLDMLVAPGDTPASRAAHPARADQLTLEL